MPWRPAVMANPENPDMALNHQWPKPIRQLTPEQTRIRDEWMVYWLSIFARRSWVTAFNHTYPLRSYRPGGRTLEVGAGRGAHLEFEDLDAQQYTALELRPELVAQLRSRFPGVQTLVGDIQEQLAFPDRHFDRVLAIHLLEHLPNLPAALDEVRRILKPDGQFSVVIPCERGPVYALARRLSAQRLFTARYDWDYRDYIQTEHLNLPGEIMEELRRRFRILHRQFFPLRIPLPQANLFIGITLAPVMN